MGKNTKKETIDTTDVNVEVTEKPNWELLYNDLNKEYSLLKEEITTLKNTPKNSNNDIIFKYNIGNLVKMPYLHGDLLFEIRSQIGYTKEGTPLYFIYNKEFGREENYISENFLVGV